MRLILNLHHLQDQSGNWKGLKTLLSFEFVTWMVELWTLPPTLGNLSWTLSCSALNHHYRALHTK